MYDNTLAAENAAAAVDARDVVAAWSRGARLLLRYEPGEASRTKRSPASRVAESSDSVSAASGCAVHSHSTSSNSRTYQQLPATIPSARRVFLSSVNRCAVASRRASTSRISASRRAASHEILTFTPAGELHRELVGQSHFGDFQDCVVAEGDCMIWTGIAEYPNGPGGALQPGGLANIDMNTGYFRYEVPVTALSRSGQGGTFNATHLQVSGDRLRMYALPDDADRPGQSCLLVLEAEI